MYTTDQSEYSVYMVDNFIENCMGRGYAFNRDHINEIVSEIIIPMYLLNKSKVSKDKYANYPDLFQYVNIKNQPILPADTGKFLMSTVPNNPDPDALYKIINHAMTQIFVYKHQGQDLEKNITGYVNTNLLNLTQQPNYPNKDKFEIPYKIEDMISFVYKDEMDALVDSETNKSKYNEMFGTDDKIIEYMMDMVCGMNQWLDDIKKQKPVDNIKYNKIIPTVNVIILYPIYMFRWMEQQIQLNKPQCTEVQRQNHTNQNDCYQTIPTSQITRKRASYVPPAVQLNTNS
jgi:hypothetical protein